MIWTYSRDVHNSTHNTDNASQTYKNLGYFLCGDFIFFLNVCRRANKKRTIIYTSIRTKICSHQFSSFHPLYHPMQTSITVFYIVFIFISVFLLPRVQFFVCFPLTNLGEDPIYPETSGRALRMDSRFPSGLSGPPPPPAAKAMSTPPPLVGS